jgi:sugar (pentulose or hexulose) kinase
MLVRNGAAEAASAATYRGAHPPTRRSLDEYVLAVQQAVTELPETLVADVAAVAVTGVRGSIIGFDDDQLPCTPVYPDHEPGCHREALRLRDLFGDALAARTGCPAFPLSGLPKLMAFSRQASRWATVQDAIAWYLTGTLACSTGSALRLGVLDRAATRYDRDLVEELGLSMDMLPPLRKIGEIIGQVRPGVPLPLGIPVIAAPGDNPAALVGLGMESGLGAGRPILVNLATSTVVSTRLGRDACTLPPDITVEVLGAGARSIETGEGSGMAGIDWTARLLGVEPQKLDALAAAADLSFTATVSLPSIDVWGMSSAGRIDQIVPAFGRSELARAALAFVADGALSALARVRTLGNADVVVLTGGGARSSEIAARIAGASDLPVVTCESSELAAAGAALTAAEALS